MLGSESQLQVITEAKKAGLMEFLRRLVIIEFSFQFPPTHNTPLQCRFRVSNTGGLLYIRKFAFES